MGEPDQRSGWRHRAAPLALAALTLVLVAPAGAPAATVRVVAPGSSREATPCSTATPCEYIWAIRNSSAGDTVQFESGGYDYLGTPDKGVTHNSLSVPASVTLEQAAGDATRPLIKQTVGFATCNCARSNSKTETSSTTSRSIRP